MTGTRSPAASRVCPSAAQERASHGQGSGPAAQATASATPRTAEGGLGADRWSDALLAARLFALDPAGSGGVVLRAGPGPVRERWLVQLRALLPPAAPLLRIPVHIADGRLLGGLDLAATLRAGRPVAERGLLAEADGGVVLLAMAERVAAATAARLVAVMDAGEVAVEREGVTLRTGSRLGVVALDESAREDERPPQALLDRLAFHLDLGEIGVREAQAEPAPADLERARALLPQVRADHAILQALCAAAMALGVDSARAALLALRVARAAAALDGRSQVSEADAVLAGRLVLAPRATRLPTEDLPPQEAPPEQAQGDDAGAQDAQADPDPDRPLEDRVLEAAQAALPPDVLAQLQLGAARRRARAQSAGRAGAQQQARSRGRPVGVRRGDPRAGLRLNVIETLRAAAPWQALRRRDTAYGAGAGQRAPRIEVRREDFRVTRHKQRTGTTTIFVVDASGSSALHRLAEAKGAVELLLADCYVRRDRVALLAFRGRGAELLLPPTRSLVRAKRSLAGLPGGGATPLAAGIDAAVGLADAARRKGDTPVVVVLTDGRANITRAGEGSRSRAEEEALAAARGLRAAGLTALLVDTSPRPQAQAQRLAGEMHARYLPLPHADAAALSTAVRAAAPA
jgi:magnesium chelatase subunit D